MAARPTGPAATVASPLRVAYSWEERRRWPRLVAGIAVALLVAIASTAAVVSYRNGRAWEQRAGRQAARADVAERQAGALGVQLDASEARVGDLQRRMSDLADEKAQAEDQREILRVYARQYHQLTGAAGGVSAELTSCIGQLAEAMALIGNPYISSTYLDQAISDCRTALDHSQTLQDLIAGMPKPPSS